MQNGEAYFVAGGGEPGELNGGRARRPPGGQGSCKKFARTRVCLSGMLNGKERARVENEATAATTTNRVGREVN